MRTIILVFLLISSLSAFAAEKFKNVNLAEFEKLRKDTNNVVLDVRSKKEFDAGHVPGATNIDVNTPDFEQRVAKLDRKKTYLVHCAAGRRSVKAAHKMAELNFTNLINFEGGYNTWEKAGNKGQK